MRADIIHAACLIRDLRDVVASFFPYTQTEQFRKARPEYQFDDVETFYYDWFLSVVVPQYRVHTFAEEYAERLVPVVRYERLYDDTLGEMRKLIRRWGLVFDEAKMKHAIALNSLDRLKLGGKQAEIFVEASHFRKGGYGNYKHDLPAKISTDVSQRFYALQSRWGYV